MPKGRPVLPVVDLEDGKPETPEPAAPTGRPHANALAVRQLQVQEKDLERASSTDSNHPLLTPPSKEGKALVAEDGCMIQVCALRDRPDSCSHSSREATGSWCHQKLLQGQHQLQPAFAVLLVRCMSCSIPATARQQPSEGRGAACRAAALTAACH